jgi:hypothetical protein
MIAPKNINTYGISDNALFYALKDKSLAINNINYENITKRRKCNYTY